MAHLEVKTDVGGGGDGGGSSSLKVVEFYSGIGGWSHAIREALAQRPAGCISGFEVVAAFDHSTTCNEVYRHNLGLAPSQKPIESLTKADLELGADLWVMSPPCQPHTRQRQDLADQSTDEVDPRSASFIHLTQLLPTLSTPPRTIVLENVVGFESSRCCSRWLGALNQQGYHVEQYHLSPAQYGMPNERPRYYLIARRQGSLPAPEAAGVHTSLRATPKRKACDARSVLEYLELPPRADGQCGAEPAWLAPWKVEAATLEKNAAWCFDIVRASDSRTACFTSSYGRFIRGTGSVLYVPPAASAAGGAADSESAAGPDALVEPENRAFGEEWRAQIAASGGVLRYFTPREVANLLGFPPSFHVPANIRPKKAYGMLGNSLHVGVAAEVIAAALFLPVPGGVGRDAREPESGVCE